MCLGRRDIHACHKVGYEALACKDTRLWEAIDAFSNACQHMSIAGNGCKIVALLDGGGNA